MAQVKYVDQDLVKLKDPTTGNLITILFWGDRVELDPSASGAIRISYRDKDKKWKTRTVPLPDGTKLADTNRVLGVRFVDVGQGDCAMVDTPDGRLVIIDGGRGDFLLRYFMVAFRERLSAGPVKCDALVATHGDADHLDGLTRLLTKRFGGAPVLAPERVFHNGLVRRLAPATEEQSFGATVQQGSTTWCTELVDDLRGVPDASMSKEMKAWKAALAAVAPARGAAWMKRLEYCDDAFAFLTGGVSMKVLGPVTGTVNGAKALPFLGDPSRTINGHSVVLQLKYGNVRFLFGGDLNVEAERRLLDRVEQDGLSLQSEILKVPHHGSQEFDPRLFEKVQPVASVVSSGDESSSEEYVHPRASLMGALGRYSREGVKKPLVFVTELTAFMNRVDNAYERVEEKTGRGGKTTTYTYHKLTDAYVKKPFGIVHVRTDGGRVLVITHTGRQDWNEHYSFTVDSGGKVAF